MLGNLQFWQVKEYGERRVKGGKKNLESQRVLEGDGALALGGR